VAAFSLYRSIKAVRRAAYAAELRVTSRGARVRPSPFARIKGTIRGGLAALKIRAVARPAMRSLRPIARGISVIFPQARFPQTHASAAISHMKTALSKMSYGLNGYVGKAAGKSFRCCREVLFAVLPWLPFQYLLKKFNPAISGILLDRHGLLMLSLAARIMDRRIPIVSGLTRRSTLSIIGALLTMEMTAGHVENTLKLARLANLTFRPHIRYRRMPMSFLYFHALFRNRQYDRITREFSGAENIGYHYFNHILGVAHLYSGKPEAARFYLKRAISLNDAYSSDYRFLGRAELLLQNTTMAERWFDKSVELAPNTVMAHQNYAGRYDINAYKPAAWELKKARSLLLYDNYGQLAEDFFLLGRYDESLALYHKMLVHQRKLASSLPRQLLEKLARLDSKFVLNKPVRLLPYEWVTQFGHIGLLDSYLKMAQLGMYPDANYVLLAPANRVANPEYLSYWDKWFTIVRDDELIDALFPYQRYVGDNFMAYGGWEKTEFWTRAAARAHIEWSKQARPPLLEVSAEHRRVGAATLAALGVPEGAWYVGLHVREGGYHGESAGSIGGHRNASIEDYIPAIKLITEQGGYVIRLGDRSMRPAPELERLIDYARSPVKSSAADIFFCSTSRFVIGTTSGLTTACVSFGTPLVLVNCVSNDWQLWPGNVHFILKPIWDLRGKRFLPFSEAFVPPVQGYLINAQVMHRKGIRAVPNTPEEIAEAVRHKMNVMSDSGLSASDNGEAMQAYQRAMADNPIMFGAALPVPAFLDKRPELLGRTGQMVSRQLRHALA